MRMRTMMMTTMTMTTRLIAWVMTPSALAGFFSGAFRHDPAAELPA
jgi:hypothetical protein